MTWQILSAWNSRVHMHRKAYKAREDPLDFDTALGNSASDPVNVWFPTTSMQAGDTTVDFQIAAEQSSLCGELPDSTIEHPIREPMRGASLAIDTNRHSREDVELSLCSEDSVVLPAAQALEHAGARSGQTREDLPVCAGSGNRSTSPGLLAAIPHGGASSSRFRTLASSGNGVAPSSPSSRVAKSCSAGRLMPWEVASPQASAYSSAGATSSPPTSVVPITMCSSPRWLDGCPSRQGTPVRGPERFFYDTSSYTGCARRGASSTSGRDYRGIVSSRLPKR